jgi:hypothetical protein
MGITTVQAWLIEFEHELPKGFPSCLVIHDLEMMMIHNTFQFYYRLWQQFVGTAMGTPCACGCVTIAYGYHQRVIIVTQQSKISMPYLK